MGFNSNQLTNGLQAPHSVTTHNTSCTTQSFAYRPLGVSHVRGCTTLGSTAPVLNELRGSVRCSLPVSARLELSSLPHPSKHALLRMVVVCLTTFLSCPTSDIDLHFWATGALALISCRFGQYSEPQGTAWYGVRSYPACYARINTLCSTRRAPPPVYVFHASRTCLLPHHCYFPHTAINSASLFPRPCRRPTSPSHSPMLHLPSHLTSSPSHPHVRDITNPIANTRAPHYPPCNSTAPQHAPPSVNPPSRPPSHARSHDIISMLGHETRRAEGLRSEFKSVKFAPMRRVLASFPVVSIWCMHAGSEQRPTRGSGDMSIAWGV